MGNATAPSAYEDAKSYIWTVNKVDGGYTFKANSGKYMPTLTSGGQPTTSATASYFDIAQNSHGDGLTTADANGTFAISNSTGAMYFNGNYPGQSFVGWSESTGNSRYKIIPVTISYDTFYDYTVNYIDNSTSETTNSFDVQIQKSSSLGSYVKSTAFITFNSTTLNDGSVDLSTATATADGTININYTSKVGQFQNFKNTANYITDKLNIARAVAANTFKTSAWSFVPAGDGKCFMKNAQTGQYMGSVVNSVEVIPTTTPTAAFEITAFNSDNTNPYVLHYGTDDFAYLHNGGSGLVGWETKAETTRWNFLEVDPATLTEDNDLQYKVTYTSFVDGTQKSTSSSYVTQGNKVTLPTKAFTTAVYTDGDGDTVTSETTVQQNMSVKCAFTTDYASLPFKVTSNIANDATEFPADASWMAMANNTSKKTIYYAEGDTKIPYGSIYDEASFADEAAYLWCVTGNVLNGFKIYNKAAGPNKILSSADPGSDSNTGGNTFPVMTDVSNIPSGNNQTWDITKGTSAYYVARHDNDSHKLNDRGSLAYWTTGSGTGSDIWFFPRSIYDITIDANKYVTFCQTFAAKIPTGVTAYYTTGEVGNSIPLTEITDGVVPANTGVVLYSETPATYSLVKASSDGTDISSLNKFKGTTSRITAPANSYGLALKNDKVGFYSVTSGVSIPAFKAYFVSIVNNSKGFTFDEGGLTGIDSNVVSTDKKEQILYELNGTPAKHLQKGKIYLTSDRKTVILK